MAEERLVDDDKDKKYRIKVNENGEEELVIDYGARPEVEESAADSFVVTETVTDNEDEAVMTPEQLAAKREKEEAERRAKQDEINSLIDKAKRDLKASKFSTALEYLERVEDMDGTVGELYALRFAAYTRNFTDYSQIDAVAENADEIKEYVSADKKAQLAESCKGALEDNINSLRNKVVALDRENEEKKAERAVRFKKDRNIALIVFFAIFAVMGAFGGLCGYFYTLIFTASGTKYLALTCTFAALAVVGLVALGIAARKIIIAAHRLKVNSRNTSTELGRELIARQNKLKAFIAVQNALKD